MRARYDLISAWPIIVCSAVAGLVSTTVSGGALAQPVSEAEAHVEGETDPQGRMVPGRAADWRPMCEVGVLTDWHADEGIPPGYRTETRIDKGWLWGGVSAIALPMVFGPPLALAYDERPALLLIPFAGPFLQASHLDESGRALFASVGVLQIGGALVALGALVFPETILVRDAPEDEEMAVSLSSWLSSDRAGLSFEALF